MRNLTTWLLLLFAAVLTASHLALFWAAPLIEEHLDDRDAELVEYLRAESTIVEARWKIVDALLDERISLTEAADRFETLAYEDPFRIEVWLRDKFPEAPPTQMHAEHVLIYAEQRLFDRGQAPNKLDRWKQELSAGLGNNTK
jgi:hypothetical protein